MQVGAQVYRCMLHSNKERSLVDPLTVILSPNTKLYRDRFGAVSISRRLWDNCFPGNSAPESSTFIFPFLFPLKPRQRFYLNSGVIGLWPGGFKREYSGLVWVFPEKKKGKRTWIIYRGVTADLLSDHKMYVSSTKANRPVQSQGWVIRLTYRYSPWQHSLSKLRDCLRVQYAAWIGKQADFPLTKPSRTWLSINYESQCAEQKLKALMPPLRFRRIKLH